MAKTSLSPLTVEAGKKQREQIAQGKDDAMRTKDGGRSVWLIKR